MGTSIPYLEKIAQQPLPVVVPQGDELDAVRILHVAGWVKARFPRNGETHGLVESITFAGQATLAHVRRPAH